MATVSHCRQRREARCCRGTTSAERGAIVCGGEISQGFWCEGREDGMWRRDVCGWGMCFDGWGCGSCERGRVPGSDEVATSASSGKKKTKKKRTYRPKDTTSPAIQQRQHNQRRIRRSRYPKRKRQQRIERRNSARRRDPPKSIGSNPNQRPSQRRTSIQDSDDVPALRLRIPQRDCSHRQ